MPGTGSKVENQIKDKLHIKWVAARKLASQAQESLGIASTDELKGREDEVLLQALKMFRELSGSEQDEMRLPPENATSPSSEPDWKRKAREQAERREKEWDEAAAALQAKRDEEAAAAARSAAIARGEPVEEISGPKRVTKVTKTTGDGKQTEIEVIETVTQEKLDGHTIKYTKVECCIIL